MRPRAVETTGSRSATAEQLPRLVFWVTETPTAIGLTKSVVEMTDEKIDIEELMEEAKKPPKDPRASARAKLRRRLIWLQAALHNADLAIEDVFAAPGRTNKRERLQAIKDAMKVFRDATGLTGDGLERTPAISNEVFDRLIFGDGTNWSEYAANTAPLIATLDLSTPDDERVSVPAVEKL